MNHCSTFEFSHVFHVQNVLKRSLTDNKIDLTQVNIVKIDICGWWFLVKLWFVDVCGTKKSCIESINNAFSYLSINIFTQGG